MIRASKNSSLRPLRGDSAPIVIRQQETREDYGFKPVPDSSRAPADSEMANPINWVLAVVLAVVLVVVLVVVLGLVVLVVVLLGPGGPGGIVFCVITRRCDLILYVNVKPSFRFD